jgi:tRNA(Ile)-lysidine synthase
MNPVRALDAALRRFGSPKRIGIALSGGGDSVALLHAAQELAGKRGLILFAFHVHHHLRATADADADFCRQLTAELSVPIRVLHLDPTQFQGNVHDAARRARYRAIEDAAREEKVDLVLTAHTLDDQAETLLFRLLRGTGPSGLAGIRERLGVFARPWLSLRRRELRDFLAAGNRTWLEDPSNTNQRFMRARLREQLLPVITDLAGEKSVAALGRLAELATEERQVLEEFAETDYQHCHSPEGLDVASLATFSQARRGLVLRRWLRERDLVPPRRVIAQLDRLVCSPGPAGPVQLPGGLLVRRDYRHLNWIDTPVVYESWQPFPAKTEEDRTFAGGRLHLSVHLAADKPIEEGWLVPESLFGECCWRPTWPGARLATAGLPKSVKLQNLFVNAKIPRELRSVWPLLVREGEILLIPGIRAGKMPDQPRKSEKMVLVQIEWL